MAGFDSYAKLLIHFNGEDGATTYTAETGQTVTFIGTAQLDTAQQKFGTASLLVDGNSDSVTVPDSADYAFGTGDFTVDCWFRVNAGTDYRYICGQTNAANDTSANSIHIRLTDSSYPQVTAVVGTTQYQVTSNVAISADSTWHHIAMVRTGGYIYLYVDGVSKGTPSNIGTNTVNDSSQVFALGKNGAFANYYWNGWIDEFRISKGIARWTADFTPPTEEYSNALPSRRRMLMGVGQ